MILEYLGYFIRQIDMYSNPDIGSFKSLIYCQIVSSYRFPEKLLPEIYFALVFEIDLIIIGRYRFFTAFRRNIRI